ncbi:MAG: transcription factor S [Candidatus Thermoplasmatota archaeon]|nr:transcription factor S [Candidatus Thermoplasmatota archaeon]
MFCPKCGALLYPDGEEMKCRKCGFARDRKEEKRIVSAREEREVTVIDEKVSVLPKTQVTCPRCNHHEAYWILRQTRAADEPETRIYTCTKCGHKWREY